MRLLSFVGFLAIIIFLESEPDLRDVLTSFVSSISYFIIMESLRRYYQQNCQYFITIVTYNRQNILLKDMEIFKKSIESLNLTAWAVLPDHLHFIISIKTESISKIIHRFKITYSRLYRNKFGSGRVWQNRFWDHIIRDETDLHNHIDYIHYNSVKHGLTAKPIDWQYSSFAEFHEKGYYTDDWVCKDSIKFDIEFGE